MANSLHITSGDIAGEKLAKTGLLGEIFVWHDILYDGPRNPGWPSEETLKARALFLEETTAGGLDRELILATLRNQYKKLEGATSYDCVTLWFDACLFDQAMLAHILTCLHQKHIRIVELLCVDTFPGIIPYHGLGQLSPEQLASLCGQHRPVTEEQYAFALLIDQAFAIQDVAALSTLSGLHDAPLPWVPAAAARWIQEQPDCIGGLGLLERLALEAIRGGDDTPAKIFATVAAADTPPRFWGDITLWAKINALANRVPPLVQINGPAARLPQWQSDLLLEDFTMSAL